MARLAIIAVASIPIAIGMASILQEMFPFWGAQIAGLIGGAVAVPFTVFLSTLNEWGR